MLNSISLIDARNRRAINTRYPLYVCEKDGAFYFPFWDKFVCRNCETGVTKEVYSKGKIKIGFTFGGKVISRIPPCSNKELRRLFTLVLYGPKRGDRAAIYKYHKE